MDRDAQKTLHLNCNAAQQFDIFINDRKFQACEGQTIAAVMISNGIKFYQQSLDGSPRGLYCGIGHCFSCMVRVDGQDHIRACVTMAKPGMVVETGNLAL
jgi:sarcosine oxidase subunit alpha